MDSEYRLTFMGLKLKGRQTPASRSPRGRRGTRLLQFESVRGHLGFNRQL